MMFSVGPTVLTKTVMEVEKFTVMKLAENSTGENVILAAHVDMNINVHIVISSVMDC